VTRLVDRIRHVRHVLVPRGIAKEAGGIAKEAMQWGRMQETGQGLRTGSRLSQVQWTLCDVEEEEEEEEEEGSAPYRGVLSLLLTLLLDSFVCSAR